MLRNSPLLNPTLHQERSNPVKAKKWDVLGEEFLTMWQQAHGAPRGAVSVMAVQNGLMVLIENAFSKAELTLARQSTDNLLQQYIDGLTHQILPVLTPRVEQVTDRQIEGSSITSNIEQNWLMIFFKLEALASNGPAHGRQR